MEVYQQLLVIGILVACLYICRYLWNRYNRYNRYNQSYPIYDIYNGPEWDSYRLGDIIKGWLTDNDPHYLKTVGKRWPNSIGDEYMKQVGYPQSFKKNDMQALRDVFSDMSHDTPDNDTAVIHVRLGDVMNFPLNSVHHSDTYVRDVPYYKRMLKSIGEYPDIRKVRIIAGAHINENKAESSKLLHDIMGVFDGYDIQLVLTHNPDKDFYYMCHSKYFVKSGGGFSNLIEKYVRNTDGIVFSEDGVGSDQFVPI